MYFNVLRCILKGKVKIFHNSDHQVENSCSFTDDGRR